MNCSALTSISIPGSVKTIGAGAFYGCSSLSSVTLPSGVTSIGNSVFWECSALTSVTIPSSVTSIDHSVFYGCSALTSVTLPNSIIEINTYCLFYDCSALTSVTLPHSVTSISGFAFWNCSSLARVTILADTPPTVTSEAFKGVSLKQVSLYVPIGSRSSYDNIDPWHSFGTIEEINPTYSYHFPVINTDGATIYYNQISDSECEVTYGYDEQYSGSIAIPATIAFGGKTYSVTAIGDYAFKSNYSLASVTLPKSISKIGQEAFFDCSNLSAVTILASTPPAVGTDAFSTYFVVQRALYVPIGSLSKYEYIDPWYRFYPIVEINPLYAYHFPVTNAEGATIYYNQISDSECEVTYGYSQKYSGNITIPAAVTYGGKSYLVTAIGDEAFYNNYNLTSVTIPNGVATIGEHAFNNSGISSISIPSSVTSIGRFAFEYCHNLSSISIPSGVTSIGDDAFYDCSALTSVTLPNSITSIGQYAFWGCSALTSISIPGSVTTLEYAIFGECTSLTSVNIAYGVTTIGEEAFWRCYDLTSINIPSSVTTIGSSAFADCSSLAKITLPSSITDIDNSAFNGCSSLARVTILATIPPLVGTNAFKGLPLSRAALYIPLGTRYNYAPNEPWKNFSQIIEIDTSALSTITQDQLQPSSIYTINGCPASDFSQPGTIRIQRFLDGTTSKLIIR